MDFPSEPAQEISLSDTLLDAIGVDPVFTGENRMDTLVELKTESAVLSLKPDLGAIAEMGGRGLIVTARGDSPNNAADFVSRF